MSPTFLYQSFIKQLNQLIADNQKIDAHPHLFVALSGGLDSTVLLRLTAQFAKEFQLDITAVHINHGLSENADTWQQHCQQVSEQLDVEFIGKSVVVEKGGQGLEGQAREARYEALSDLIANHARSPYRLLLTGQHQQDQVETYLLRLKRGSGIKGLGAMAPSVAFRTNRFNHTYLLRPLLDTSRKDLELYGAQQKLSWVDDESNLDTRFDRNFLRHQVLPLLNERWTQFDAMVCRSASLMAEQQQLIDEISEQDLISISWEDGSLCCESLLKLTVLRRNNVLRLWLETHGASMPSKVLMGRISDEMLAARDDAQPQISWRQNLLRRFKGRLYLTGRNFDTSGQAFTLTASEFINKTIELKDTKGNGFGRMWVSTVSQGHSQELRAPEPDEQVRICYAQKGQYNRIKCQRLGHQMTQKLGDLFKYFAVPPWLRSHTPLIYYNQQLVAVAGLFVCAGAISAGDSDSNLKIKVVIDN